MYPRFRLTYYHRYAHHILGAQDVHTGGKRENIPMRVAMIGSETLEIGAVVLLKDHIGVVVGNTKWDTDKKIASKTLFRFKRADGGLITEISSMDIPKQTRDFCVVQDAKASLHVELGSGLKQFNDTVLPSEGLFIVDDKRIIVSRSHQEACITGRGSNESSKRKYAAWDLEIMEGIIFQSPNPIFHMETWHLKLEGEDDIKSWLWKPSNYDSSMSWVR
jgi:hypothetical protein